MSKHLPTLQRNDQDITPENKSFIQEAIQDKYSQVSPINAEELEKSEWDQKTVRSGVIARNIGNYPLWKKDGSAVYCTLLQVRVDSIIFTYISFPLFPCRRFLIIMLFVIYHRKNTPQL